MINWMMMMKLNKLKLPRATQIINCKSIEFADKDMIVINDWEDFLFLLGNCITLYKLKESIYYITGEVVYIYNLNGDEIE